MPYTFNNSDGSVSTTVADSTIDTSTYALALVGRNVSNYGLYFAQNAVRQLENFASATAPRPLTPNAKRPKPTIIYGIRAANFFSNNKNGLAALPN